MDEIPLLQKDGRLTTSHKKKERLKKETLTFKDAQNALQIGILAEHPDAQDMSLRQLAAIVDADKTIVKTHLETYRDIIPRMTDERRAWFKENRVRIFEGIIDLSCEVLITQVKNGELNGRDITKAIETLTKLGRLEQGKSTENIAHAHHVTSNTPEIAQILIDPPKDKE